LIAEHNGTTIDYDENPDSHDLVDDHRAVLNPGGVLGSADGSNSTSQRETRYGTQPDGSVNPGAA
jgi:hypothetical protein